MSPDVQLLERYFAEADREALEVLVVRHYPAVYQTILHLVHDSFDAKDIAQATFLELIRVGRDYRGTGSFRSWLLAIAVNQVRQHRRKRALHPREDWLQEALQAVEVGGDVSDDVSRREFEQELERSLERMPVLLKEPLVLHYYESLSFTEIAEVLALPRSTVQSRVEKAIAYLRRDFRAHGAVALVPCIERFIEVPTAVLPAAVGGGVVRLLTNGVLLMKSKSVLGVALLVLVAALGLQFSGSAWNDTGGTAEDSVSTEASASIEDLEPSPLAGSVDGTVGYAREALEASVSQLVFGLVVDEVDKPLAGASLRLFDYTTGGILHATSAEDGTFSFEGTQNCADLFFLTVAADEFARSRHGDVRGGREPITVRMERGRVLLGHILDHRDQPVTRYRMRVVPAHERGRGLGLHQSGQLLPLEFLEEPARWIEGPLGAFEFGALASGDYVIIVEREGHQPWRFSPDLFGYEGYPALHRSLAEPLALRLHESGHWNMRVYDAITGEPILGAEIHHRIGIGSRMERFPLLHDRTAASADGVYSIEFAAEGDLGRMKDGDFVVSKPGYAPYCLPMSGQDSGFVIEVPLAPAASLGGTVYGPGGEPQAGAIVLYVIKTSDNLVARTVTDEAGNYRLEGVPAYGRGELCAFDESQTMEFGVAVIQPKPGEHHVVDLGGGDSRAVFGTVKSGGETCRGVLVVCYPDDGQEVRTYTDTRGRFRLDGLPAGGAEFVVSASKKTGLDTYHVQRISIPEDSLRLDFDFDQSIRGRLLDTASRMPVKEVTLRAHLMGGRLSSITSADVNDQGEFEFTLPVVGTYELRIDEEDAWYAPLPLVVEVRAGAKVGGVEFLVLSDPESGELLIEVKSARNGLAVERGSYELRSKSWLGSGSFSDGVITDGRLSLGKYVYKIGSPAHVTKRYEFALVPGQSRHHGRIALELSQRVVVVSVVAGSNAGIAGMLARDVLSRYDGKTVASRAELEAAKAAASGRDRVSVEVARDGRSVELDMASGRLGIECRNAAGR